MFAYLVQLFAIAYIHIALLNSPTSQNATLGDVAKFTCSIQGTTATVAFWHVDGIPDNSDELSGRGIAKATSYDYTLGVLTSVLSVACEQENNNTMIRCFGYLSPQVVSSPVVKLLIQGMFIQYNALYV